MNIRYKNKMCIAFLFQNIFGVSKYIKFIHLKFIKKFLNNLDVANNFQNF